MTQSDFNPSVLRGAVDLSGLGGAAPAAASPAGAASAPGATGGSGTATTGVIVQGSDATFNELVTASTSVPTVLVLWAEQMPESRTHVDELIAIVKQLDGRLRLVEVELTANPGIMQAITPVLQQAFGQVSNLPVVLGLLSGQPVPLYLGAQDAASVRSVLDQLLQAAVANGVTGRVTEAEAELDQDADAESDQDAEPELPEAHQRAFDAIEAGDYDTAAAAYQQALADDATDEQARLGLAQVELLRRTQNLDPTAVRAAAAENPADVKAQIDAADLDLAGGHVDDAFGRLLAAVRATAGADRDAAREHLLGLFEVVGAADPRVVQARRDLMSALF